MLSMSTPHAPSLHVEPIRPNRDSLLLLIGVAASVVFLAISATAKVPTYRINPVFLLPLLWGPYLLRRPLFLKPLHYLAFAVAIFIHDLGAYGFYQTSPLPFSYDI